MHVFAAELAISERDLPVGEREQSMVLAQADVVARVPLGAALAHNDVAGANGLAAELLHAEALAFTVAAVAGRAACFLMCHVELLRFRTLLGRGLSRCSIFCRRRFRLRSSFLGRGLVGPGCFSVGRCGIFGRLAGHFQRLVLVSRRLGGFLRTRSSGLVRAGLGRLGLGRGFGLRSSLLFSLVITN